MRLNEADSQAILFTIISFEFNAYVITRQVVNVFEYAVAWRGKKGKFRQDLRQAKTYEEWKAAARRMDKMLGFDEWKETEDDGYYDYFLVCPLSVLGTQRLTI
jgi:hypothetical protein